MWNDPGNIEPRAEWGRHFDSALKQQDEKLGRLEKVLSFVTRDNERLEEQAKRQGGTILTQAARIEELERTLRDSLRWQTTAQAHLEVIALEREKSMATLGNQASHIQKLERLKRASPDPAAPAPVEQLQEQGAAQDETSDPMFSYIEGLRSAQSTQRARAAVLEATLSEQQKTVSAQEREIGVLRAMMAQQVANSGELAEKNSELQTKESRQEREIAALRAMIEQQIMKTTELAKRSVAAPACTVPSVEPSDQVVSEMLKRLIALEAQVTKELAGDSAGATGGNHTQEGGPNGARPYSSHRTQSLRGGLKAQAGAGGLKEVPPFGYEEPPSRIMLAPEQVKVEVQSDAAPQRTLAIEHDDYVSTEASRAASVRERIAKNVDYVSTTLSKGFLHVMERALDPHVAPPLLKKLGDEQLLSIVSERLQHVKNETEEMDLEPSMWGCTMLIGLPQMGTAASVYTGFLLVLTVSMQVGIIVILRIVSHVQTWAH